MGPFSTNDGQPKADATRYLEFGGIDSHWLIASSKIAKIAALSTDVGTIFDQASRLLSRLGPTHLALFVMHQGEVHESYTTGFSKRFIDRAVALFEQGHRLTYPTTVSAKSPSDHVLWPELALDGIEGFCAWPLETAGNNLGELYVGVPLDSRCGLPPVEFMETFASAVALAIDRNLLKTTDSLEKNDQEWHLKLLESIVEDTMSGVLVTDADGRTILLNPVGEQILDVREIDVVGKQINDVNPRLSEFGTLASKKHTPSKRVTFRPGDNASPKVAATRISRFEYGGKEYLVWNLKDETISQALETRISEQQSRISAFVDNSHVALFSCNEEGTITSRNSSVIHYLDAEPQELTVGSSIDASSTLVETGIAAKIRECLVAAKPLVSSLDFIHRDRGPVHLTAHYTPIISDQGGCAGVQTIIDDSTDYVRTCTSLIRSEERYRIFFNNAPIPIFEIDLSKTTDRISQLELVNPEGFTEQNRQDLEADQLLSLIEIVAVNPAAVEMYKAESSYDLIYSWTSILDKTSIRDFHKLVTTLLSGETSYRFETTNSTFTKNQIHVSISAAVAPGFEKDLSRVLLSILDVTRMKAMEKFLQDQLVLERLISRISAKFVSLQPENTTEGILRVLEEVGEALSLDNMLVFEPQNDNTICATHSWQRVQSPPSPLKDISFTRGMYPIFSEKLRRFEMINLDRPENLEPGSDERRIIEENNISNLLLIPLVAQEEVNGVLSFVSRDKHPKWPTEILSLLRILADVIANALDRKQREHDRQKSEDLLRTVFQSMGSGVMVIDKQGIILLANPAAAENFQFTTPDELIGTPLTETVPGTNQLLRDSTLGEQQQIVLHLKSGATKTFGYTSASAPSGEQRILVFRDLTKIIDAGERQKRAEELARLGMMVAKLSHEIKNPLTSILFGLRTLEDNTQLSSDGNFILQSVLGEVRFLKSLIGRLLDANRFQDVSPKPASIAPVIERVHAIQSPLAAHKGVPLVLDEGPGDTILCIDQKAISRVITNLIQNAIEACEKNNRIRIGWRSLSKDELTVRFPDFKGAVACIFVEDDGPGIPKEVQGKLFVPFTTTKSRGTGLGLSIVREIVSGHGGVIEVLPHSNRGGRGTRFEILLIEGTRKSCQDHHGGCGAPHSSCPVPDGCPVREADGCHVCWTIKGRASVQENGRWNNECTTCPVFLEGNLEHYYAHATE